MTTFPALSAGPWLLHERRFHLGHLPHFESIFALANGYMGVRASLETNPTLAAPGFYVAGVFDRVGGHTHEIVNLPCWLELGVTIEGFPLDLTRGRLLDYRRTLDLRQGVLCTRMLWRDAANHTTRLETVRLVHKAEPHTAMIWGRLTPLDYATDVQLASRTDAWAVKYASPSGGQRLDEVAVSDLGQDGILLTARTRDSGITVAIASQLAVDGATRRGARVDGDRVAETLAFHAVRGRPVTFCKRVSVWTSRDGRDPAGAARRDLRRLGRCAPRALLASHRAAWRETWDAADIGISGDPRAQQALRFSVFHLASLANPGDDRVSLGAKGLHGNGYAGLVFWDTEIFMLPFYIHTQPETAAALLRYRRRHLDDARRNARDAGRAGAFYPWNTSLTGRERRRPHWQEHVGSDIAYGIDWYVRATGDRDFWLRAGAEMFLATARYWQSRVARDDRKGRYVIRDLMGPDEIHGGIDNNAYTNLLVRWHLRRAAELVADLRRARRWTAMRRRLALTDRDVQAWLDIAATIYDGFRPALGCHEQFEGYLQLEERAIDRSHSRMAYTGPVQHSFRPSKVAQQADTPLLYWMLGEEFPAAVKRAGYRYYEPRCSHTSSLSHCIYSALASQLGWTGEAYRQFLLSAESDLAPGHEMESENGIHAACMGGTWLAAVTGFGGLWLRRGGVDLDPRLPRRWKRLAYTVRIRGRQLEVAVTPRAVSLRTRRGRLPVRVRGRPVEVGPRRCRVRLR